MEPLDDGGDLRQQLEARPARAAAPLKTSSRLLLAFGALAGALLVAVGVQLAAFEKSEREREAAEAQEERLLGVIQLESALRRQFAHHPHALAGDPAHLAEYREARRDVTRLARELSATLRDSPAARWVTEIEAAAGQLDRTVQEPSAPPGVALAKLSAGTGDASALVFDVDLNVARLFEAFGIATITHRESVARGELAIHRIVIALIVALALLALTMTVYVSRSVARPMARLGDGAARIAGGDLDTRIDIRTTDEFGALASQLNQVASHLQEHRARLCRAEPLAAVGRCTAELVHELNSSLQVMLGYLTVDRDRMGGELPAHYQRIEREARHSTEIVNGVLAMSRAPAPRPPALVDLGEVAREVVAGLRAVSPSGGPELSVRGGGVVYGPRSTYQQIICNLARNAADAAGAGGRVRVDVSVSGVAALVAVEDTGPGVAPALRERIFEPFFTTKPSGTGLGLSVSRSLAAGLGGDIEVAGGEIGGARFTLRLPRHHGAA